MTRKQKSSTCWTALGGTSNAEDGKVLLENAMEDGRTNWSISRRALPGHTVIFYMTSPISSFVATGVVSSHPIKRGKWWFADIEKLQALKRPYHIRQALLELPKWGWLKSPVFSVPVPEAILPRLWHRIEANGEVPSRRLSPKRGASQEPKIPNDDEHPPARITFSSTRIVRTTKRGMELKKLYEHRCQCCSKAVPVPGNTSGYVEVHHMRPLGGKHGGMDNWDNMLVLCPNCHAAFDLVSFAINPKSHRIQVSSGKSPGTMVKFRSGHFLSKENLKYHWRRFQEQGPVGQSRIQVVMPVGPMSF